VCIGQKPIEGSNPSLSANGTIGQTVVPFLFGVFLLEQAPISD
jgi:hypothetical protein